jgi:hypothetical protein
MRRHCLPIEQLRAWATLNDVKFNDTRIEGITNPDGQYKGAGLFAARDFEASDDFETSLLSVPHDLVLSLDLVHDYAKSDGHLRDVLEAVGEFGWVGKMYGIRLFACAVYKLTCTEYKGRIIDISPSTNHTFKSRPPRKQCWRCESTYRLRCIPA